MNFLNDSDSGFNVADALEKDTMGTPLSEVILESDEFVGLDLPPKASLLHPWLTEQSIGLISADRGTGKTWFAMSVADAITKGATFGPWETETPVPVLYLEGEMAAVDVQSRILDMRGESRIEPLFIYSDAYASTRGASRADLNSESWRDQMTTVLNHLQVKLFIVDNISSLSPGIEENAKESWDPINQWLLQLRFAGISSLLIHHTNKDGGQRGTSGREDNLDYSIMLKKMPGHNIEAGAEFVATFTKARIPNRDLPKIADAHFKLIADDTGAITWAWNKAQQENRIQIIKRVHEGCTDTEIASEMGVHKTTVGRQRKKAITDGYLDGKNKMTPMGFDLVYGGQS